MVRAHLPQNAATSLNTNDNHSPQGHDEAKIEEFVTMLYEDLVIMQYEDLTTMEFEHTP